MGAQHRTGSEFWPGQDPAVLREHAYADDCHLDTRRTVHQLYTVDPVDFGRWTLERVLWHGDERVLDIGCGPGDLLGSMGRLYRGWGMLVGLDFSAGMVAEAASRTAESAVHFLVGDAQELPFPDGVFDVVMARHMLYHVPDIDRAVAEAARVLRPAGHFLVTTNSAHTMPEYRVLRQRAAERFPAMIQPPMMISDCFSLENGPAFLEPHFGQVETHTLPGTLRFPTAQPFVDYFASTRALTMRPAHTDAEWLAVLDFVRVEAEAILARQGYLDVTKVAGAILGMKGS